MYETPGEKTRKIQNYADKNRNFRIRSIAQFLKHKETNDNLEKKNTPCLIHNVSLPYPKNEGNKLEKTCFVVNGWTTTVQVIR